MRPSSRWIAVVAAPLIACNALVGFDDLERVSGDGAAPDRSDAASDDARAADDGGAPGAAGPRCNPRSPFGEPELLAELDGADQTRDAVLSADEREVFFLKFDGGKDYELRHGRRADRDAPFATADITTVPLAPPPSGPLSLAAGGLKLYYRVVASSDGGSAVNYVATRASTAAAFGSPRLYSNKNEPLFIVATDDFAYWSEVVGGAEMELWWGVRDVTSPSQEKRLANVHAAGASDQFPTLDESQMRLYFISTRSGGLGLGDVYTASRPNRATSFGAPTHVRELSTTQVDRVTWVASDDCVVLITRQGHIWRAHRPR